MFSSIILRSAVDKNETIEHEIIENRKRINDVQTKQSLTSAENEAQHRREAQIYRENSEKLQVQCKELRREKDQLANQLNEHKTEVTLLEGKIEQTERQLEQSQRTGKSLENECASVTVKLEASQCELSQLRDRIFETNRDYEMMRGQQEAAGYTVESKTKQIETLSVDIERLQQKLRDKSQSVETLSERLRQSEQEKAVYEERAQDEAQKVGRMDETVHIQREEIDRLNEKMKEWRLRVESEAMEHKELLAVSEINEQNTK